MLKAMRLFTLFLAFFITTTLNAEPQTTKTWRVKVFASVVGQSNESGAGKTPSESEPPAPLMRDPVGPNGGRRSWWPKMSTLLAQQKISFRVANTAVGATSLARSWVGMPINWKSGELVTKGSLFLSAGRLWKCVDSTAQYNIGVTTHEPSIGKQSDGFSWIDLGPIPSNYFSGRILREGDLGFDPNGYIFSALSSLSAAEPEEKKVVIISIGQGDKTFRTNRIQFHDAIASVSNFFRSRKIIVFAGFTSPIATQGGKEWYANELKPGWQDFINENKKDSMIVEGADLDSLFGGNLAVTPVGGPGLQNDLVHMNDSAYEEASKAWAEVFFRWSLNLKRD